MTFKPKAARTEIAAAIPNHPAVRPVLAVATPSRYIRMSELATTPNKPGLMPVSPATAWRWVREGRFPKPFKLGESVTVWDRDAVEAFIAKRSSRGADVDPVQ
ncbi:AlpA family phage regulatory protein [Variovorax sp. LjRoot130]|uniref:helix-turn-helix transcriptional regulator n=1 Tax=Variovorax sp. LjRoot130 TaxID=3342261 RepID=UPI003ED0357D